MPKKISLEEVNKRLYDIHKGKVTLVNQQDYKHTHHKVMFNDVDFGDWEAMPYSLFSGKGHPERGKEKAKQHFQEKFGVDNPYQSETCKEKIRQTMLNRYGVEYAWQTPQNKALFTSKEAQVKKHHTMIKNKTYKKSSSEDSLYEVLCIKFNSSNIIRQILINSWNIDFYIKSLDTYIQFDGIYWHGLSKPIEQIMEFKNPRDKTIYKTWCRDKEQNEWFYKNKLKLIRITDKDWLQNNKDINKFL